MATAISVERVTKSYRLGIIGSDTIREDLARWWARMRGAPDPVLKVDANRHHDRQVGKTFWALDDVSFDVDEGEVLGVIGRNGAGKSTLLKILSQVTAPSSGRVTLRGRVASLLEVGTGFHPELTGRENVLLNGAILGMTKAEIRRKFDEIVAFSECEAFIDTPVKRYSSGMYVRLAFAVAAHLDPEILVVDEVLAVGDAQFQRKCLGKIRDVSGHGRTVLFVSHSMPAILALCTRAVLLKEGHLAAQGDPTTVVAGYQGDRIEDRWSADIRERTDRTGTGALRCVGLRIRGSNGETLTTVSPGQPFSIDLAYETRRPSKAIDAVVNIETTGGIRVATLWTGFLNQAFVPRPGGGTATCEVQGLPLRPDRYFLTVGFGTDRELADMIENAAILEVIESDVYGTGRLPDKSQGILVPQYVWRMDSATRDHSLRRSNE
jgi:homopolymeric O-antigen transport system ATP-binding protein